MSTSTHTKGREAPNTIISRPSHAHSWRIEEANGPVSMGTCPCGAEKEFKNWLAEGDFITQTEFREAYASV